MTAFVGVEAPLNLPLLPWNADPPTGVGRKAMGRITALPLSGNNMYVIYLSHFVLGNLENGGSL